MQTFHPSISSLSPSQVRRAVNLSRERMARLLDVSAKTIERWEAQDAVPSDRAKRERLADIAELAALGKIVYSAAGFERFLATPLPVFHGMTALQLIEQGKIDQVLAAVVQDYEGLGS